MNKLAQKQIRNLSRNQIFISNNNQINDANADDDIKLISREPKILNIDEDTDLNHRGADDTEESSDDITINTEHNQIDNIYLNPERDLIILKDTFNVELHEDGDVMMDDSDAIFCTDEHKINTDENRWRL